MAPQQPTPKVDAIHKLMDVMTTEQITLLTDVILRAQGRAVERGCDQSVTLIFNNKGYPRYCRASDDMAMPTPKMYNGE
jgi:hypothetical protein